MKDFVTAPSHVNHHDVTARLRITERNIARGHFSDVSKGTLICHDGGSIQVAIKTFRYRGSTDSSEPTIILEKLRKKLRQEANILGCLDHPNVAPMLGLSVPVDSPPSLISPWYPNGSLTTYLKSSKEVNRVRILYDLSCGLEYLHSRSIVHGDIKPENVLIDADGRACWCDFGLAHLLDGAAGITGETSSSTFRGGTVRFFSPEQLKPEREGQRKTTMMDIWAFGCLMAQVMSGEPLYGDCKAGYLVCVEIMQGNLPMNTLVQVTLHPVQKPLWMIVDQCWRKDPNSRPTAIEVSDGISKLMDSSQILSQKRIRQSMGLNAALVLRQNDDVKFGVYPNKVISQGLLFFFLTPDKAIEDK